MSVLDECNCTAETLAMASFPKQKWCEPYKWEEALSIGTIFPCLDLEFFKGGNVSCPCCGGDNSEQNQALNEIYAISFAINDLTLYLDTHPDCGKGLPLYNELLAKRLKLLADYESKFHPLTQTSIVSGTPDTETFGWAEGPAPWEGGLI